MCRCGGAAARRDARVAGSGRAVRCGGWRPVSIRVRRGARGAGVARGVREGRERGAPGSTHARQLQYSAVAPRLYTPRLVPCDRHADLRRDMTRRTR